MLEWISRDALLVVGLSLDIAGVVILAIPDVPPIARLFRFGRLREARDGLQFGGLNQGDSGFAELVKLHNEAQDAVSVTTDNVAKIEYGPKLMRVLDDDQQEYEVENRLEFEYLPGAEFAGMTVYDHSSPPEIYYPDILRAIERGERRLRITGLLVIGLGFSVQFVGLLIG